MTTTETTLSMEQMNQLWKTESEPPVKTLSYREEIAAKFNRRQLSIMCRRHDLKAYGSKQEMIERLLHFNYIRVARYCPDTIIHTDEPEIVI